MKTAASRCSYTFEMSVLLNERHFFLGLSDELATISRGKAESDTPDISLEARVKLYPRQALSTLREHGSDQLFFCRKHLVWSTEHRERVRFEASGPIVDAELCPFAEEPADQVLCVAEPGLLSMYSTDGDLHEHSLKSPVRALWPTPIGIIVEGFEGVPAQLATHMISGLQPLRTMNADRGGNAAAGAATWAADRILFAHASTPIVVTSDEAISNLRIWCLKSFPEGTLRSVAGMLPQDLPATATPVMPPSAVSSKSRVRTPDDHIQAHVFTAFRSAEQRTASTWVQEQVRPSTSVLSAPRELQASPEFWRVASGLQPSFECWKAPADAPLADTLTSGLHNSPVAIPQCMLLQVDLPTDSVQLAFDLVHACLLYTSPSPRD